MVPRSRGGAAPYPRLPARRVAAAALRRGGRARVRCPPLLRCALSAAGLVRRAAQRHALPRAPVTRAAALLLARREDRGDAAAHSHQGPHGGDWPQRVRPRRAPGHGQRLDARAARR